MNIIKFILGIFFIIYGFIFSVIERFMGLPFFFSKDQINGVINGFVCIIVGVVLASSSIEQGVFLGVPILLLCIAEQKVILKFLKKRENKFIGREGIASTDIRKRHKGYVTFNGKQEKVVSETKNIDKDKKVIVSRLEGYRLIVKELEVDIKDEENYKDKANL